MNNKGQTLVLFLIVIPVIVFLFVCFYQLGMIKLQEKNLIDTIEDSLEYGVNNVDNELLYIEIREMITETNDYVRDEDIEIIVESNEVNVIVKVDYKTILFNEEKIFDYTGRLVDGNIEIVENRG